MEDGSEGKKRKGVGSIGLLRASLVHATSLLRTVCARGPEKHKPQRRLLRRKTGNVGQRLFPRSPQGSGYLRKHQSTAIGWVDRCCWLLVAGVGGPLTPESPPPPRQSCSLWWESGVSRGLWSPLPGSPLFPRFSIPPHPQTPQTNRIVARIRPFLPAMRMLKKMTPPPNAFNEVPRWRGRRWDDEDAARLLMASPDACGAPR